MVTRTFRTRDGRAAASVTVEGVPEHRIRVAIDGEDVELAAGDHAAPTGAASNGGRTAAATATVRVTTASATGGDAATEPPVTRARGGDTAAAASGTLTSVRVSSSSRVSHHRGFRSPSAGEPRGR